MDSKGQVNQIFIFVFSVLIVAFGGFLVVSFVGALNNDVGERVLEDTLSQFKLDYTSIRNEFNSEALHTYKIPGSVETITFVTPACTLSDSYITAFKNGYFIVFLDSDEQVLEFTELDEFGVFEGCLKIDDKDVITLAYKNSRNVVTIEYIE